MDEQAHEYAMSYWADGNRASTCREILAGPNPIVMAAKVAVNIMREDFDRDMAEEFIRILEDQME